MMPAGESAGTFMMMLNMIGGSPGWYGPRAVHVTVSVPLNLPPLLADTKVNFGLPWNTPNLSVTLMLTRLQLVSPRASFEVGMLIFQVNWLPAWTDGGLEVFVTGMVHSIGVAAAAITCMWPRPMSPMPVRWMANRSKVAPSKVDLFEPVIGLSVSMSMLPRGPSDVVFGSIWSRGTLIG